MLVQKRMLVVHFDNAQLVTVTFQHFLKLIPSLGFDVALFFLLTGFGFGFGDDLDVGFGDGFHVAFGDGLDVGFGVDLDFALGIDLSVCFSMFFSEVWEEQ